MCRLTPNARHIDWVYDFCFFYFTSSQYECNFFALFYFVRPKFIVILVERVSQIPFYIFGFLIMTNMEWSEKWERKKLYLRFKISNGFIFFFGGATASTISQFQIQKKDEVEKDSLSICVCESSCHNLNSLWMTAGPQQQQQKAHTYRHIHKLKHTHTRTAAAASAAVKTKKKWTEKKEQKTLWNITICIRKCCLHSACIIILIDFCWDIVCATF